MSLLWANFHMLEDMSLFFSIVRGLLVGMFKKYGNGQSRQCLGTLLKLALITPSGGFFLWQWPGPALCVRTGKGSLGRCCFFQDADILAFPRIPWGSFSPSSILGSSKTCIGINFGANQTISAIVFLYLTPARIILDGGTHQNTEVGLIFFTSS